MRVPLQAQWAEIELRGGAIRKHEFYYGSSYLSQSSRAIAITPEISKIKVFDAKGELLDQIVFNK
jgi:hypothetical protein